MAKKKKKKSRRRSGKPVTPQLKEKMYQSGLSYFLDGEYEKAIREWGSIDESSDPKLVAQLAEAYFRNAMSKYEPDNMKAVISELHSALKCDIPGRQPLYLFHIGLAYHSMEKFPQAIRYYTRAVKAAPEVERYRYHLGLAHLQSGEVQKSIEVFETIRGAHGRMGEVIACIYLGHHERALKVLDTANDGNEFKLLKGLVYLTQGNYDDAKPLLKEAAKSSAGKGVADYYLGLAHVMTDAMPSAIKAWEDASRKGLDIESMKDDMVHVYRQLAARYFDRGNLDRVVKIWEKLLELEPEDDEARRNLVHAYFLRGNDYAKAEQIVYAIRYWEKAWELDSTNADIAHNLALAHEKRNELRKAMEYWKAAASGWKRQISANGDEKEVLQARMHTVHTHLADIALETDDIGRAIAEYRQALRYAPDEVKTIVKLADLYMMQGNANSAVQQLSRARRLSPTDTDVLQQLSLAYVMQRNLSRSIECMKEILEIDPGNRLYQEMVSQYYLGRAEDALESKEHEAALRFLEQGLEVCPNHIELRSFSGAVYLSMGDKSKAEAAFRETIGLDPMEAKTYIAVGRHYLGSKMIDDAELYFAKAIELDPGDTDIYTDIADEYCHSGNCEYAIKYFEMAKAVKPGDASVLADIADKLLLRDCAKYGLQYARELMSIAPNAPNSYFFLGLAYHLSDMNDEAIDTLMQGTDIAAEAGDEEILRAIDSLIAHIEFEGFLGNGLKGMIDSLMGDFDGEEW